MNSVNFLLQPWLLSSGLQCKYWCPAVSAVVERFHPPLPPNYALSFSVSVLLHSSTGSCFSYRLRLEYSFPLHEWMTSCWYCRWQYSISRNLTLSYLSQPLLPFYLTDFLNCKMSFEMDFYSHPALSDAVCSSPRAPVGFWVVLYLVFIPSSCDTDSTLAISFLK